MSYDFKGGLKLLFHHQTKEEVLEFFKTDETNGLSADAVSSLKEEFGENKLKEKAKKTLAQRFFAQFKDAMILILIAAAVVSFVVACIERNPKEFFPL